MTTMAEHVIAAGAYYRPLMLEKSMYNSWKSRMKLYIRGKKHGKDLIDLILHGPLQYGMVVENGVTRPRTYEELTDKEKIRKECDIRATNIVLQAVQQQPQVVFPQLDSGLVVPSFLPGDDPIASLNKSMEFISTIISSRYPTTNNQLRTSSNPRNQATIQDGRVTVQNVQGRQSQSFMGNGLKSNDTSTWGNRNVGTNAANQTRFIPCYNYQGEGHMARQCTQSKRPTNSEWFKEKMLLVQACPDTQTTLPINAAFQIDNLDDFDSDYDEAPSARAVLMANLSSYDFAVILEVPISDTFQDNYVLDHCVQEMYYYEQPAFVHTSDIQTTSDSNIISYDQYMKENESEVV
ncbi:hypothetical protein Tco_0821349 [Tanacetum coccineum]|uniref:Integrase, catalytic region, zinc finger, CCHC-type, peptidase aspartic, catalytic n=1 Tax=Tanacetum coccineum TaxID=301880 RepID=A0ABQ5AC09_9ASTR